MHTCVLQCITFFISYIVGMQHNICICLVLKLHICIHIQIKTLSVLSYKMCFLKLNINPYTMSLKPLKTPNSVCSPGLSTFWLCQPPQHHTCFCLQMCTRLFFLLMIFSWTHSLRVAHIHVNEHGLCLSRELQTSPLTCTHMKVKAPTFCIASAKIPVLMHPDLKQMQCEPF